MSIREDFSVNELLTYAPVTENRLSSGETLEVIIPDKYPDAAEIISLSGFPSLKGRDESAGIILQTVYELSALVRAEDGSVFPLSTEIPVTIRSSLTREEDSCCHAVVYSLARDARIVNSRKLAFSCEVGANLTVWSPRRMHYLTITAHDVIAEKSERTLMRRSAALSESFFISDELPIPAGKPEAESIVTKSYRWKSEEQRLTNEKLIVRAVAALEIGYLTKEGEWNTAEFELPFTRIFDLPSVNEDARFSCRFQKGKITVLPQMREENTVFAITIAAEAHILCYETMNIETCDDLYSLQARLTPAYEGMTLPEALIREEGRTVREEIIEFPRDPESIASFSLSLSPATVYYAEEGHIRTEVTAYADFLYLSEGKLYHLEKKFPVDWECTSSGTIYGVTASVASARYTLPAMRKSEINLTVDFNLSGEQLYDLRAVSSVTEESENNEALPSFLYIQTAKPAELFSLGKKYHADPRDIADVNGLEAETPVTAGTSLLIPVHKGNS